ncbi:hypothetical protein D8674_035046 [Pyrus ussuriensis x Pyrus communis]|uniref:RNase H type-1 domain-containing protein n=1 Tax=Pyrus ussuriensis x Pyrus communis TaxID=2448454 RepID=A0A5N5GHA3_9ROSA|nr:hypothetical protein D8674_035046 [Pyrus ussuriensis x Pyrus communis]
MSHMGSIIEDVKHLLSTVSEACVAHIRRQANSVAHRLARFALHCGNDCTWLDAPPSIICDLLEEDVHVPCTN